MSIQKQFDYEELCFETKIADGSYKIIHAGSIYRLKYAYPPLSIFTYSLPSIVNELS